MYHTIVLTNFKTNKQTNRKQSRIDKHQTVRIYEVEGEVVKEKDS